MGYARIEDKRAFDAAYRKKNQVLLNFARRLRYYLLEEKHHYDPVMPQDRLDWCDDCWARHSPERRAQILRRLLPAGVHDIREAFTCIWGHPSKDDKGARKLYRDLHRIGAVRKHGTWELQERQAA